jgi:hypothetical protein
VWLRLRPKKVRRAVGVAALAAVVVPAKGVAPVANVVPVVVPAVVVDAAVRRRKTSDPIVRLAREW